MKKLFITLQLAFALTCAHAQKAYTLQDWNIKDYAPGVQTEQMAYSYATSIEGPWTYGGFVSTSANYGFTIHPSVIQFKNQWYYIYHDGSYMQNGEPGGQCRRSVCAEYLYFDKDGKIKFVPLTQEGLSEKLDELKRTLEAMEIDYYKPAVKCARSRILSGKLK